MKKIFARLLGSSQPKRQISPFYSIGFHGDQYLLTLANYLLKDTNAFFETGANVGTTLAYFARMHPHLQCASCEPDPQVFLQAVQNTNTLPNVFLFNEASPQFLEFMPQRFAH